MSTTSASRPTPKILVSFKDQNDDRVIYKVKADMNIMKLIKTYCDEKQIRYRSFEFLYNGNRLLRSKTLAEVGFKDGDDIDVLGHVSGGGPSK